MNLHALSLPAATFRYIEYQNIAVGKSAIQIVSIATLAAAVFGWRLSP
jgi:hypothetical protein